MGLLNLICGIAAAIIVSNKGHSGYQIAMHAIAGILCCGIGSLISALVAKDLRQEKSNAQMWFAGQAQQQNQDQMRYEMSRMQREIQELRNQQAQTNQGSAYQPPMPAESGPVPSGPETSTESTAWLDDLAAKDAATNSLETAIDLRVVCTACGKRFSGKKAQLSRIKACPKCGVTPFEFRELPPQQG
ncbi:MAG: hypothetical protein IPP14_03935 [Planctomycetes bacterium]|nr:hypothetical protein [Planctomycetota bacterium]